jgi:co-chaperonin GroES (HSP10)
MIPALSDCAPGLRPTGFNIIVAMAPPEAQTRSGLHLPDSIVEKAKLTEVRGRLVAMSPACFDFADFAGVAPKQGDVIQFAKLAGVLVTGSDGRDYRVMQDKDVVAIVEEQ